MYQIVFNEQNQKFRVVNTINKKFVNKSKRKYFTTQPEAAVFVSFLLKRRDRLLRLKAHYQYHGKNTFVGVQ